MNTEIVHVTELKPGDRVQEWGGDIRTVKEVESWFDGWLLHLTDGRVELIDLGTCEPLVERVS